MRTWTTYWVSQGSRVGWFLGQYWLSARLTDPAPKRRPRTQPSPSLADLLRDLGDLLRRDWKNVRSGIYRLPHDALADPRPLLDRAVRYFRDLPAVNARRQRDAFDEVRDIGGVEAQSLPDYYLRNFHYQTGGYLTTESARLYDQQVDVLFLGSADAMRRQALPAIAAYLRRHRRSDLTMIDVGCGTGRFLSFVRDNFPDLTVTGIDLSSAYLREARRTLQPWSGAALVRAAAERLPYASGAVDIISCIYLLHEVPGDVRHAIIAEFARVMRPGGRLIVVDSLQRGDHGAYDTLLDSFPDTFHEPYYADYAASDLKGMVAAAGFRPIASERAFLSKVMVFDRLPAG